ncbi:hypothetical protein D1614_02725 [Maribellus luteus]|uniref:Uncharacterized protein n=1 Tax=Maribellus luteus TaxID=2305463 RepID=A0A399T7L6_9BACT|nr:hypothetical protein D1614_02725 [Maribellus luteus]
MSESLQILRKLNQSWQDFYNNKLPHYSLEGKTPFQKLKTLEKYIPIQPK